MRFVRFGGIIHVAGAEKGTVGCRTACLLLGSAKVIKTSYSLVWASPIQIQLIFGLAKAYHGFPTATHRDSCCSSLMDQWSISRHHQYIYTHMSIWVIIWVIAPEAIGAPTWPAKPARLSHLSIEPPRLMAGRKVAAASSGSVRPFLDLEDKKYTDRLMLRHTW